MRRTPAESIPPSDMDPRAEDAVPGPLPGHHDGHEREDSQLDDPPPLAHPLGV